MGVCQDGVINLDKAYMSKKVSKVIVTFLEDNSKDDLKRLNLEDFSFKQSREKLESYKSSLSDTIIEERRNELRKYF